MILAILCRNQRILSIKFYSARLFKKKRRTLITIGIHVVGMGSWKKREVGKFEINLERMKLESSRRSWKIFDQYCIENFPT